MFSEKKKEIKKESARRYLDILPTFITLVKQDMPRHLNSGIGKIFLEISNGDYDIVGKEAKLERLPKLLKRLKDYGLLDPMTLVMNRGVGQYINDEIELSLFIEGLTKSLSLDADDSKRLAGLLRQHPALIYCRLLELIRMT